MPFILLGAAANIPSTRFPWTPYRLQRRSLFAKKKMPWVGITASVFEWFFRRRRNTLNQGTNGKVAFRLLCITDLPREKLSLFHSLRSLLFLSPSLKETRSSRSLSRQRLIRPNRDSGRERSLALGVGPLP